MVIFCPILQIYSYNVIYQPLSNNLYSIPALIIVIHHPSSLTDSSSFLTTNYQSESLFDNQNDTFSNNLYCLLIIIHNQYTRLIKPKHITKQRYSPKLSLVSPSLQPLPLRQDPHPFSFRYDFLILTNQHHSAALIFLFLHSLSQKKLQFTLIHDHFYISYLDCRSVA